MPDWHPPRPRRGRSWEPPRIRVLIADDDARSRNALVDLVLNEGSLELVGAVLDAEEAVHLAHVAQPDVAVVDARMARGGGPKAARGIRQRSPQTRVVALSDGGDRASVLEMLHAGIDTYLDDAGLAEDVVHAIHHVGRGQSRSLPDLVCELTSRLADQQRDDWMLRRRTERVRRLVDGENLGVVFQPIVDLRDGRVLAVEALARITAKPVRSPDRWIAEAWALGLGVDLEVVALRTALAHLGQLPREMLLTVNASPRTFVSPEFLSAMEDVPSGRVVVEITEDAPVEDFDVLEEAADRLRARGVRLAIDDAGAGFSSLGGILRLAPEFIKLDISLIRTIASEEAGRTAASALIRFASDIGAEIIAEGVEAPAQLQALRRLGVAYGQGFLLARPASLPPAGQMPARVPLPADGELVVGPVLPRPHPTPPPAATREPGPAAPVDWSELEDVIRLLRRTAASDPYGRAGGPRARIRALKTTDRLVGQHLVHVGGGPHVVRYSGVPPEPGTLRELADELERMTRRLRHPGDAGQALRVFDERLHRNIPPSGRG